MANIEPLRQCPQCGTNLEKTKEALRDIAELSFCLECQFPILLVAGKYRLRRMLAKGGFGKVYLARHVHLDRDHERVIKVINHDVFSIQGMEARFRREVQVTGALSQINEHIVRIYDDFGEIPKLGHFYVMEYLEGHPLTQLVSRSKRLPSLKVCFHVFRQLCESMEAAHKESIVHRDLKPDNIFLIERQGDPYFIKVLDFGIAKPMDRESLQSTNITQGSLGTPPYMSPEQCNDNDIDHRTDLYAIGIIMYEMLVGHTPFYNKETPRSALRVLHDHLTTAPPSVRELRPDRNIPEPIERVVMKTLSKSPSDRYDTAQHLLRAMAEAYHESGISPPGVPDEVPIYEMSSEEREEMGSAETWAFSGSEEWPVPDSTSFPKRKWHGIGDSSVAAIDSAAHQAINTGGKLSTQDVIPHRRGFREEQPGSHTDQHPIREELPSDSRAIHRESGQYPIVPEGFVTNDSGQHDIGILHAGATSEHDDDWDEDDELALKRSAWRPLLMLLALFLGGGLWGLLVVTSWNERKTTMKTLLPQAGAVCGGQPARWREGALRVLVVPLVSPQTPLPADPKAARKVQRLQQLRELHVKSLKAVAGVVGKDFLSIKESAVGFDQFDPAPNHARAHMYGKLCHAHLVLSGGWLDGRAAQQPKKLDKLTPTPYAWLRMFMTYTGTSLQVRIGKKKFPLDTPPQLEKLLRTDASDLLGERLRHLVRGLVFLFASNKMAESRFLSKYLLREALTSLKKARVLQPQLLPKLAKVSLKNLPKRPSVYIPAGPFWMGPKENALRKALPPYYIDQYEVSREAYAVCVLRGACPPVRNFLQSSWMLPRDRVTLDEAKAYCKYEGKELPTPEQWVKAARGGLTIQGKRNPFPKRMYTWGNQAHTCAHAHALKCYRSLVEGDLVAVMINVRRELKKGISPYGVHHMIGNASEIVSDGTVRGGSGYSMPRKISWKGQMDQRSGLSWIGFRCAYLP